MTVGFLIVYALWLLDITPLVVLLVFVTFLTLLPILLFVTHGL
jgi:hypothetical protein